MLLLALLHRGFGILVGAGTDLVIFLLGCIDCLLEFFRLLLEFGLGHGARGFPYEFVVLLEGLLVLPSGRCGPRRRVPLVGLPAVLFRAQLVQLVLQLLAGICALCGGISF